MSVVVETRRYGVAVTAGIAGAAVSMLWSTNSPAADTLASFYQVTPNVFFMATGSYYAGNILGLTMSLVALCHYQLRKLAVIASSLGLAGAIIRMFSYYGNPAGFLVLCGGNFVGAFGSSVIVGLPNRIGLVWFGPKEQATASGITMMISGSGSVLGYLLSAYLITDSSSNTYILVVNGIILLLAIIAFVLSLTVVRDYPKIPPSSDANQFRGMKRGLKETCCHLAFTSTGDFWLLLLEYGIGQSVNWNVQLFLNPILTSSGVGRNTINNMGAIMQLIGFPAVVLAIIICNRGGMRWLSTVVWWLCELVLILFGLLVTSNDVGPETTSALYGMSAAVGIVFSTVSPIMFPFISHVGFPTNPSILTLSAYMAAQISAMVLLALTTTISPETGFIISDVFLGVVCLLSLRNPYIKMRPDHIGPGTETIQLLESRSPFLLGK